MPLKKKEVDDVLGGEEAWKNVQKTDGRHFQGLRGRAAGALGSQGLGVVDTCALLCRALPAFCAAYGICTKVQETPCCTVRCWQSWGRISVTQFSTPLWQGLLN